MDQIQTKPDRNSSYSDVAQRDEYLDQKLRTAARIVWLATCDPLTGSDLETADPLEPNDRWIETEAAQLRALLVAEERPAGRYWELRWHVLRLLGVAQSYASSSRAVERRVVSQAEAQRVEAEEHDSTIRDWVLGPAGRS